LIATLAGAPLTGGYIARREAWTGLHHAGSPWLAWVSTLAGLPILYGGIRALLSGGAKPLCTDELPAGVPGHTTLSLPALFVLTVSLFVCLAAGLYSEPFLRFARYAFGI
jgi:hypothetical protein